MTEYKDNFIKGRDDFLDEAQGRYIQFESDSLVRKYMEFLAEAEHEAEMQYFFEVNPALLPGLYDLHNGPRGNVVISKLKLADEFVTDFAFISVNSSVAQITLIEIESPKMTVFRDSDDIFTSKFNQALQQVRDWSLWTEQNSTFTKDIFRRIYHREVFRFQRVITRTILIGGRRSEIQKNQKREKRWASLNQESGPIVMSYDRLPYIFHLNPALLHKLVCRPAHEISRLLRSR